MRLTAGEQLHQLVLKATVIDDAAQRLSRSRPHEISAGIAQKKSYVTNTGKLALPTFGTGVSRLQQVVAGGIPNLSREESKAVWASLLQTPALLIERDIEKSSEIEPGGWLASELPLDRLRQLTLVSVFRHAEGSVVGPLATNPPFAGVANLTLAPNEGNGGTADAWLSATWHDSTRALMEALEPAFMDAGLAQQRASVHPPVMLIHDSDWADLSDLMWRSRLGTAGAIAGVDVNFMYLAKHQAVEFVIDSLVKKPPSWLITVGTDPELDLVQARFARTSQANRGFRIQGATSSDLLQTLREKFASFVGVSPALQLLAPRDTSDGSKAGRPGFPFEGSAKACLHLTDGRQYLLDSVGGLWWTRDTANHGEVVFKTYERTSTQLLFEADRDMQGNRITDKHKGPVLDTIEMSELHSCGKPADHR